jgi:hypothetical protein
MPPSYTCAVIVGTIEVPGLQYRSKKECQRSYTSPFTIVERNLDAFKKVKCQIINHQNPENDPLENEYDTSTTC